MSKIFSNIIAGTSIAFCMGGVAAVAMPTVEASASTVNYDILRDQNVTVNDKYATILTIVIMGCFILIDNKRKHK